MTWMCRNHALLAGCNSRNCRGVNLRQVQSRIGRRTRSSRIQDHSVAAPCRNASLSHAGPSPTVLIRHVRDRRRNETDIARWENRTSTSAGRGRQRCEGRLVCVDQAWIGAPKRDQPGRLARNCRRMSCSVGSSRSLGPRTGASSLLG